MDGGAKRGPRGGRVRRHHVMRAGSRTGSRCRPGSRAAPPPTARRRSRRRAGARRPPSPALVPGHQVHRGRAHMRGHEGVARPLEQLVRRADLDDRTLAQHADALAHAQRLELVGRGIEHGHAELAVQPLELGPRVVAQLGVEIGQRLVEQQQPRPADQRPADGDALLLAAAGRAGLALEGMPDAQHLGHLGHPPVDLAAARSRPRAAGRPDCCAPSGAGRGRRSGRSSPCRGPGRAPGSCPGRRTPPCPARASRARRWPGASSSCRPRSGPAGRRTRPPRRRRTAHPAR